MALPKNPPIKPFVQGNTFAGSGLEDSILKTREDSAILADSQKEAIKEYKNNLLDKDVANTKGLASQAASQKNGVYDAGARIATALQAINAFIPGDPIDRFHPVIPDSNYNPYKYGTGSQAIAKSGISIKPSKKGSLHKALGISEGKKIPASKLKDSPNDSPAMKKKKNFARNARKWKHEDGGTIELATRGTLTKSKAKEMLKDGTAHGHKLSKKQKRYFGMVAAGKADDGMAIPPTRVGGHTDRMYDTYSSTLDLLSAGGNPLQTDQGKVFLTAGRVNDGGISLGDRQQLMESIMMHNQDPRYSNMSAEARTNSWFDYPTNNPVVQKYKDKFKSIGYGPSSGLQSSTSATTQNALAKMPDGGTINKKQPLIPTPHYNFSIMSDFTPNAMDSALYNRSFNGIIQNDPDVMRDMSKYMRYGLNPLMDRETLIRSTNVGNAYDDARNQLAALSAETNRPLMLPPDTKGKPRKMDDGGMLSMLGGGTPDPMSMMIGAAKKLSNAPVEFAQFFNKIAGLKDQPVMKNGGTVGDTMEFTGPSHENGGIPISYAGKNVEVEGGETAFQDSQNNLHIMGNMKVPGTNKKFKSVSKAIMEKEQEYNFIANKGTELVNAANPHDKFERLSFNSGELMMKGGVLGKQDLAPKKEMLARMQNALLDTAQEFNLDPQALSEGETKKAKKGTFAKAASGKSVSGGEPKKASMAERHNNPGNIKYSDWSKRHGAVKGEPATDGGYFAKFPDTATGLNALRNLLKSDSYKNMPVDKAIKKWTGGVGYNMDISEFKGKTVGSLKGNQFQSLVNTITGGEDGKYYKKPSAPSVPSKAIPPTTKVAPPKPAVPWTPTRPLTPYTRMQTPEDLTPTPNVGGPSTGYPIPPALPGITPPAPRNIPSNAKPLSLTEVLPELMAFGNNKEEPVPVQFYHPDLYSPYQVSLQDRRNDNTSTFNTISRQLSANPAALGQFAAQKYQADSAVGAEEFRINQGISNDVTNKNVSLLNDAQLKNLGIQDQQMVRQSQARSNTKAQGQVIANSIASKYLQNNLENERLQSYENLYDYRFGDQGIAEYKGPDAQFNFGQNINTPSSGAADGYTRTRQIIDASKNIKQTILTTPSPAEQQKLNLEIQKKKEDASITNLPSLFRRRR